MRILFILENYYPNIGGVETLFKLLAESLVDKDYKVTVLTNRFDNSLLSYENIKGVEVHRLNLKNRYLFTFFAGFKAIKFAKEHDLIHTTSYNAALPAFISSIFASKKILITFHEVWGRLWFSLPFMNIFSLFFHYCFEWFILKLPFYRFIAVSNNTKQSLIKAGIKEDRIKLIYNGIDYNDYPNCDKVINSDKFQFCYFGRLGISKGLDLILDSILILKNKNKEFTFLLILPYSPNGFLNTIQKLIDKKGIRKFIKIKHELSFDELKASICQSNTVVIPSYSEGFCYTAIESMALGIPIISSARGSLKEVVNGKYLEFNIQNPESLANCMELALQEKWNYRKPKKFPLDQSIKSYIDLYQSLNQ